MGYTEVSVQWSANSLYNLHVKLGGVWFLWRMKMENTEATITVCIKELVEDLADQMLKRRLIPLWCLLEMSWVSDTLQSYQKQWGIFQGCLLIKSLWVDTNVAVVSVLPPQVGNKCRFTFVLWAEEHFLLRCCCFCASGEGRWGVLVPTES